VPTVAESGFTGFEDYTWVGVFVPKDTPLVIINKLNADIATISKQEDFKERLASLGFEGVGGVLRHLIATYAPNPKSGQEL
jgi:tripartite-type tricarboxylate transporter receptor subunit TctC